MDDKDARIAALEAELAAADDRYSRLAGRYGDECERREAAEALLREIEFHPSMQSKCPFCFGFDAKGQGETPRKHRADCRFAAHFAHYKD